VTAGEICRSYLESFATRDADKIAAHVTDDFINEHTAALGSGCEGIDEYRRRLPNFIESMPDLRYELEDVIVDGDRVVIPYMLRARVTDPDVAVRAMRFDVRDQRIARRVDYWDSLVFQRQAGLT